MRNLTASISAVDDVRLCVGVLGAGPSAANNPFYLSDYSRGKICLELRHEQQVAGNLGALNQEALQTMFMESLDALWKTWNQAQAAAKPISTRPIATPRKRGRPRKVSATQKTIESFVVDDISVAKFIAQLPLAEITLCTSATALEPRREKGRKRLRELTEAASQGRSPKKARETTGKENLSAAPQSQPQPTQAKITEFASVRKNNLLDRILAKQAVKESGPAPLSQAELQRRAALQRSEEVIGILSLLAASKGSGSRASFPMSALLQSLQGSIRTPLSREEMLRCVEVLASEVAPEYLSIVKMGAISSVVINQAARPHDVRARLVALGAM
jgi:phage gp46-like protein